MQIGSTAAYASLFESLRHPRANGAAMEVETSAASTSSASPGTTISGNRSGLVSQLTAYAIRQTQLSHPSQGVDTGTSTNSSVQSWAGDLKDSDRKMLESMTGYSISKDGNFTDKDGNTSTIDPSFAAVIAAISLARAGQAQGIENIPLDDTITPEQYTDIISRVQVAMFQAGDIFDKSVRDQGLEYLKGLSNEAAEVAQTSTETGAQIEEDNDPKLSLAKKHHAQDMVNDPVYAAKEVEKYATTGMAMFIQMPVPANGDEGYVDPKVVQASYDRWMKAYKTVNDVHANAKSIYDQGVAEGKSPAEIYRNILRDQLSQSDAYWEARDPDHLFGNMKESTQAELDELEKVMAAKQEKTADSKIS